MNIAFVYDGAHIATPALSGSILPGITRDSVLRLAPDLGYTVSEERIDADQALADIRSGRITEVFGIGWLPVIAPVGTLARGRDGHRERQSARAGGPASVRNVCTDIQTAVCPIPTDGRTRSNQTYQASRNLCRP